MKFNLLTDYLPYAFTLIIAIPFLVLLRQLVYSYIDLKNKELKLLSRNGIVENRTHAYERMILFLERIKPAQLIQKFDKDLATHDFIFLTKKTILEEFEYNASQQLYLSKNAWENLVGTKSAIIDLMQTTYGALGNNTNLEEFKTVFIMNYIQGEDYINQTIDLLRKEVLIMEK